MTPQDLDAFLRVAREHGVSRLKIGDVEVELTAKVQAVAATPVQQPEKTPEEHWDRVEGELFGGLPT